MEANWFPSSSNPESPRITIGVIVKTKVESVHVCTIRISMTFEVSSRIRTPTAGDHAFVVHAKGVKLPKDLKPKSFVFIDAFQESTITVRLACGVSRELPPANLDCIREYLINGEWVPETDRRAQDDLLKTLEKERAKPEDYARSRRIEELEWILRRNNVRLPGVSPFVPASAP
jgi:hypothetical protein